MNATPASHSIAPLLQVASAPGSGAPLALDAVRGLLRGLDRGQRQAVTHGEGPLLVVAGPGTGKTEVITRRIAWLIATGRARASEVLALTFTERAADEMQTRVDVLLPYGQVETAIHTFHAFGDRLVRMHGLELGLPGDPRVIGRPEAIGLLREHIFELGLVRYMPLADPTRFVAALVDLFARAKEAGIRPSDMEAYARELAAGAGAAADPSAPKDVCEAVAGLEDEAASTLEIARAFARYQALLTEGALLDHADQVDLAVRLLSERPVVRSAARARYRYVVVDEAQDANPQQLQLVRELVGGAGNVTFVGDDDQAIYGFRGAVGAGLARLSEDFAGLRCLVLRRNYRSRAPILEAARRLIRGNDPHRLEVSHGLDKTLTAVRRTRRPALVRHRAFASVTEEADHVASEIRERLARGAAPGAIAVLVRTNADAGPVLASLQAHRVPTWFSGASGLYAHREVRDVLSLLRAISAPQASEDLYAVMASDAYSLGGEDLTAILELASRRRRTLWSVCLEVLDQPGLLRLAPGTRSALTRLVRDLRESMVMAHERSAPEVLYAHLRRSGWLPMLMTLAESGDEGPLRRVARVFEIVREAADLSSDARIASVVPRLRASMDAGDDPADQDPDERSDSVNVLTVHQAKGLEFKVVYIVGLAEGRFPIRGGRTALRLPLVLAARPGEAEEVTPFAEERRLLYVAMTRARDELLLSHATHGARAGRERRPSSFLAEALGSGVEEASSHLRVDDALAAHVGRLPELDRLPAPAAAKVLERPLDLSFTQVDDYLTCPLKYRLRHRLRVPTAANHALVVGNALHQAAAMANMARLRAQTVDETQVMETYRAHWSSEGFLSPEHEGARFAAGELALRRFMGRASQDDRRIIAVERPFSVRIGATRLRGRLDAVSSTPEGVVITDYKTGDMRDPVRAGQRARTSLQLQVYSLAYETETGQPPAAVELHFLEGDVIGRATPSERQRERARERIAEAASGIRRGSFDATPGYPACEWCPYRRICPSAA